MVRLLDSYSEEDNRHHDITPVDSDHLLDPDKTLVTK